MRHLFSLAAVLATTSFTVGRNIDVSTVPSRETVQLTIYNAEDLTLVRETRRVTFKKGVNPLQFSWANTLIDPTSVVLRFPKDADKLDVLDTTYPHDKPQMLYWNVQSEEDREATVEISYFTSGLTWSADYVCITDPGESRMAITGFVRVFNQSGEEYENAQVRLVVGTINLVEKIAELARRTYGKELAELDKSKADGLRREVAKDQLGALAPAARATGSAPQPLEEKQIIKEGLSEYFIYTVEGTETIPNGWSKRMRSFEATDVPFRTQYRYRPAEYGESMVRLFLLRNDKESKLGDTPLPDGIVRVYRENGKQGLGIRAQQQIKYVPIGEQIELNLGPDAEVIHEWVKLRTWREHIWFQRHGFSVYSELGGGTTVESDDTVVGWEDHARYIERVRNYRGKPIEVEIRRAFPGHTAFISQLKPTRYDFQTVQITATCAPGKTELPYHIRTRQGHLAKQQNVTIETGD